MCRSDWASFHPVITGCLNDTTDNYDRCQSVRELWVTRTNQSSLRLSYRGSWVINKQQDALSLLNFFQWIDPLHVSNELTIHHQKAVAYRRGAFGGFKPLPKFRRLSKIVPNSTLLWKLLKIAGFRTPTPQDVRKKGSKILKLPRFAIVLH